jgi:hypothetical protein
MQHQLQMEQSILQADTSITSLQLQEALLSNNFNAIIKYNQLGDM